MILSLNLEFYGDCMEAIRFYSSHFDYTFLQVRLYNEMPSHEAFGITNQGLNMVWQASFEVRMGKYCIRFNMSDSLLLAMGHTVDTLSVPFRPVVCIAHPNNKFSKLMGVELCKNSIIKYGIEWTFIESEESKIFYSFEFEGFCQDVIYFYESVFDVKAIHVVRYGDLPYTASACEAGKDMIYSAMLEFCNGDYCYAFNVKDSLEASKCGMNSYDPNALLFYKQWYNPVLNFTNNDDVFLSNVFNTLLVGGKTNQHITRDDNDAVTGSIIDRYGICWNLSSVIPFV